MIDCNNKRLIDQCTERSIVVQHMVNRIEKFSINFVQVPEEVKSLLNKYPSLVTPKNIDNSAVPNSKVEHCKDTGDSPTYGKSRQLSEDKLKIVKNEFKSLLDNGIIRPSKSSWSSPLHLVPKSNPGEYRPCGDYRVVNSKTVPDRYPLPNIHSISSKLYDIFFF